MKLPSAVQATRRERLAITFADLLRTFQNWPWLDTLRTLRLRFREDHLGLTAGSLTFTTLISLVPLFTVMLALFSAFPMFSTFQGSLETYFLKSLVPDDIAKPVLRALTQFANKANRLGTVGLIVLVLTALALMLTIDRSLNAIWRVRKSRPIAQRVLVYWAAATLGPLLLGVSLSATSLAISASKGLVGALPGGVSLVLNAVEFALLAGALAGLFHYVPNTPVRWVHALAGGVFVAAGLEVAKNVLGWYLVSVPTYSVVYGAFATVPIFLVWIYASWVIVLMGAVIAAYAPSLQMHVVRHPDTPGYRFQLAVSLIRLLDAARSDDSRGMEGEELARALRIDPLQIEPILETLVDIDWVGRLDEPGSARHVLLCDPDQTSAEPLLSRLLLEPSADVRGFWQQAGFSGMTVRQILQG